MVRPRSTSTDDALDPETGGVNTAPEEEGDLALEAVDLGEYVWVVYKPWGLGEPLPPGVRAGGFGAWCYRFTGPPDLEEIRKRVGPGTWRLVGRLGKEIKRNVKVTIAGEPWPLSRINPAPEREAEPPQPPGVLEAERFARENRQTRVLVDPYTREALPVAPALTEDRIREVVRGELAAAARPGLAPDLSLLVQAFELVSRFTKPQTPADPSSVLQSVVEAFKSGIELGREVNPDQPAADPTAKLLEAVVPLLSRISETRRTEPPAGVTVPARPAALPAATVEASDGSRPSRQAAIAEMLARGITERRDPAAVADAADLLLGPSDGAELGGWAVADLMRWLGPAALVYPSFRETGATAWLDDFLACYRQEEEAPAPPSPPAS